MVSEEEFEEKMLALNDAGKFEELEKECSEVLEKEPRNYIAIGYLTNVLLELEKTEKALEYCNKFLSHKTISQ